MSLPVTMDGVCLMTMSAIIMMTVEITVTNRAAVCIEYTLCQTLTLSTPPYTIEA